jgi:hypothetical protein
MERLLFLLRALAERFAASRQEFVAMNLDGIYQCVAEQEDLCRQIQALQTANSTLDMGVAGNEGPEGIERLRTVMRELRDVHAELGRLSQTHAAFLRRSGRTMEMLLNSVANYALTYTRPAPSLTVSSQVGGS